MCVPHLQLSQLFSVCFSQQVVAVLDREYEAHYSQSGEIDERDFLTLDFSKFASPRWVLAERSRIKRIDGPFCCFSCLMLFELLIGKVRMDT